MSPDGMSQKYQVERIGDASGKHDGCAYFVLDPNHDAVARQALFAYALATPDRHLSADLLAWLRDLGYTVGYLCRECSDAHSGHSAPCPVAP